MKPSKEVVGYVLRMANVPMAEEIAMMLCRGHSHKYEHHVVEPTCLEGGYTEHICTCGERYQDGFTDALGHGVNVRSEENRVEATHEAAGSYDVVTRCGRCGMELNRETYTLPMLKLKGYLYNGVLLPGFESWMTEKERYFVWMMNGGGSCMLFVMDKPLPARVWTYTDENDVDHPGHDMKNTTSAAVTYSKLWGMTDGTLSFPAQYRNENYTVAAGDSIPVYSFDVYPESIFWANYDVYTAVKTGGKYVQTDTLLFPKSPDPVPVYE